MYSFYHHPMGGWDLKHTLMWLNKEEVCPGWGFSSASAHRICLQCKSRRRCEFDPWIGKIPWKRAWQSRPSILAWRSPRLDRGAWHTVVRWIAKSQTGLKQLGTHTCIMSSLQLSSMNSTENIKENEVGLVFHNFALFFRCKNKWQEGL